MSAERSRLPSSFSSTDSASRYDWICPSASWQYCHGHFCKCSSRSAGVQRWLDLNSCGGRYQSTAAVNLQLTLKWSHSCHSWWADESVVMRYGDIGTMVSHLWRTWLRECKWMEHKLIMDSLGWVVVMFSPWISCCLCMNFWLGSQRFEPVWTGSRFSALFRTPDWTLGSVQQVSWTLDWTLVRFWKVRVRTLVQNQTAASLYTVNRQGIGIGVVIETLFL